MAWKIAGIPVIAVAGDQILRVEHETRGALAALRDAGQRRPIELVGAKAGERRRHP